MIQQRPTYILFLELCPTTKVAGIGSFILSTVSKSKCWEYDVIARRMKRSHGKLVTPEGAKGAWLREK